MPGEGAVLKIRKKYNVVWKAYCCSSQLHHGLAGFRVSSERIGKH